MSNRTDWKHLTKEILNLEPDLCWHIGAAGYEKLFDRIVVELHNAWVAGAEGSKECKESKDFEKFPDKYIMESDQ